MKIEELDTPAVIVDLDVLENNISRLSKYAGEHGLRLRPHVKTHKIPAIAKMQIASGCSGITVAKVGEAEVMTDAGIDDILLHYPILVPAKAARLAKVARKAKVTVALDSLTAAEVLSVAAVAAGSTLHVLAEFDSGMRRCGVVTAEQMTSLARGIAALPNLQFAGITTYPGHVWTIPAEQEPALAALGDRISEMSDAILRAGLACSVVSAGSTPTAYNSHLVRGLTEMRPGTYVFNDRNTLGVGACALDNCALRLIVTVVSNSVPGRAIVDGGSKTFCSDRWLSGEKTGFGLVVERPELLFEAMSEEHGHLQVPPGSPTPQLGEKLTIIPNHVCACVNMHGRLYYHRKGMVEGSWEVAARGMVR